LEDGTYFGELALVMEDKRKTGSVVAVECCTVYILSRTDFQHALSPYPELLAHLQNIALAHLEQPLDRTSDSSSAGINISSMKIRRKD
jgi:CRP-like cAMP-binding protein